MAKLYTWYEDTPDAGFLYQLGMRPKWNASTTGRLTISLARTGIQFGAYIDAEGWTDIQEAGTSPTVTREHKIQLIKDMVYYMSIGKEPR